MTIQVDPDWWKTIFDDVYLLTDARSVCNAEVTCREVDLICQLLPIHPEHRCIEPEWHWYWNIFEAQF